MVEPAAVPSRRFEVRKYFRRWSRNPVSLRSKLEILTADGRRWTTGTAVIRDLSLRGARLGKIVLRRSALPARSFQIRLAFQSQHSKRIGALCRPIRFGHGPDFELAVEFVDFWTGTAG